MRVPSPRLVATLPNCSVDLRCRWTPSIAMAMIPAPARGLGDMPKTTFHMSISLDGFVAGPNQDRDNPIGVGGMRLHRWHLADPIHEADASSYADLMTSRGAYVMGRNMFAPGRGEWDEGWRGWWGEEPPYHAPVFVLTHHAREPV